LRSRTIAPEYNRLLTRIAPKVIHSEKENDAYVQVLYELDQRGGKVTSAKKNWLNCLHC
jgi:hypothetical protein